MYDCIVIGAGASGMMAAIEAARSEARVCLLEKSHEAGKKLLRTGNGKCNMTHEGVSGHEYTGCNPETDLIHVSKDILNYNQNKTNHFISDVIKEFNFENTIDFFESIGIFTRSKDGYVYPYSGTALSVRNALWEEVKHSGCDFIMSVNEISLSVNNYFDIGVVSKYKENKKEYEKVYNISSKTLIVACGSPASMPKGYGNIGYDIAKSLGISVKKFLPALVKMNISNECIRYNRFAAGVRHIASADLYEGDRLIGKSHGEVQWTKEGLSGIPIFQLSSVASRLLDSKKNIYILLDLIPDFDADTLSDIFDKRKKMNPDMSIVLFWSGFLPSKLAEAVCVCANISGDRHLSLVSDDKKKLMIEAVKKYFADISSVAGIEDAQVCSGGISCDEIYSKTMESKKIKGLFFVGESVDVDGPCGGYNLQWAWSSGALAGRAAAKYK